MRSYDFFTNIGLISANWYVKKPSGSRSEGLGLKSDQLVVTTGVCLGYECLSTSVFSM